ncbi:winged helix-turn-helix transcriptional regulator [Aquabacter cavernae]|uniref:winged helix-turn-helix transcriptional regulator n=1 Tax=Aquabacter cavernae TaxID=2496029 RepID=UPI000F8F2AB3|nr:helix-turn-helix domain-containing protein [Aquabacter cavernae]
MNLVIAPADLTPDPFNPRCPTRLLLDRIADKWTVLLLTVIAREPVRFNALRREVGGISQKVLSQTLKSLERDGLVTRTAYPTVPVTVEYALTPLGISLAATLAPLALWAATHMGEIGAAQDHFDSRAGAH